MQVQRVHIRKMLRTISFSKKKSKTMAPLKSSAHTIDYSLSQIESEDQQASKLTLCGGLKKVSEQYESTYNLGQEKIDDSNKIAGPSKLNNFRLKIQRKKEYSALKIVHFDDQFSNLEELGIKKKMLSARNQSDMEKLSSNSLTQNHKRPIKIHPLKKVNEQNFHQRKFETPSKFHKKISQNYKTISGRFRQEEIRIKSPKKLFGRKNSNITPWQLDAQNIQSISFR